MRPFLHAGGERLRAAGKRRERGLGEVLPLRLPAGVEEPLLRGPRAGRARAATAGLDGEAAGRHREAHPAAEGGDRQEAAGGEGDQLSKPDPARVPRPPPPARLPLQNQRARALLSLAVAVPVAHQKPGVPPAPQNGLRAQIHVRGGSGGGGGGGGGQRGQQERQPLPRLGVAAAGRAAGERRQEEQRAHETRPRDRAPRSPHGRRGQLPGPRRVAAAAQLLPPRAVAAPQPAEAGPGPQQARDPHAASAAASPQPDHRPAAAARWQQPKPGPQPAGAAAVALRQDDAQRLVP